MPEGGERDLPILGLALSAALSVLFWLVFIQALLSWVPGVVSGSMWLMALERAARRIIEPILSPIRQRLPGGAAVDFSPFVLLLLIEVARWVVVRLMV